MALAPNKFRRLLSVLTRRLTAKLGAVSYTHGECVTHPTLNNENRVERKPWATENKYAMHVKFKEEKHGLDVRILLLMPLRAINSRHETES